MMKLANMIRGLERNDPAERLAARWKPDAGTLACLRASSNFVYTFRMDGRLHYLRFVHEEDKPAGQIRAELDFIMYLRERGYPAAAPVRSGDGNPIESIAAESGRYSGVVFEQAEGVYIPLPNMSDAHFEAWGRSLGELHLLSESYEPEGEPRHSWSEALDFAEAVLRRHPEEREAWRTLEELRGWLAGLPADRQHAGLVHYDFQTDNIFYMEDRSRYCAIDFDDAMYHWYMADVAAALSDLGDLADLHGQNGAKAGRAARRFMDGYRSVREPDDEWTAMLPRFGRFRDLYSTARLLRCLEDAETADEPEWAAGLRNKLLGHCRQLRERMRRPIAED